MATLRLLLTTRIATVQVRCQNYSTVSKKLEYRKCCNILGVSENSDQEEIRTAYLKLVKKYHPDSGSQEADSEKFSEIDKAFKTLINRKAKERWDVKEVEVEEQDIKHTAPQHRQYLSYGGMGSGTPSQRQRQYTKFRAQQAAENVLQHRISKVSTSADEGAVLAKAPLKHKIKTKYGFDRLVEDLIQESMSKGEFSNLSGVGKPLPDHQSRNPYVDFVTHKLNEVLIDNGFTPEWITLHKEIREEIRHLRDSLLSERTYFGACPLSGDEDAEWAATVLRYDKMAAQINKKVDKFNLVVPILEKQMIQVSLSREAQKALANGKHNKEVDHQRRRESVVEGRDHVSSSGNIFDFIDHLFGRR